MATVLTLRSSDGQTREVRVSDNPKTINAVLAKAAKEDEPFVVFTNAETEKEESFQPERVISFVAE